MIRPISSISIINLLINLLTVLRAIRTQALNADIDDDILDNNLLPNQSVIMLVIHLLVSIQLFMKRVIKFQPLAKPHKLLRLLHGYR